MNAEQRLRISRDSIGLMIYDGNESIVRNGKNHNQSKVSSSEATEQQQRTIKSS